MIIYTSILTVNILSPHFQSSQVQNRSGRKFSVHGNACSSLYCPVIDETRMCKPVLEVQTSPICEGRGRKSVVYPAKCVLVMYCPEAVKDKSSCSRSADLTDAYRESAVGREDTE